MEDLLQLTLWPASTQVFDRLEYRSVYTTATEPTKPPSINQRFVSRDNHGGFSGGISIKAFTCKSIRQRPNEHVGTVASLAFKKPRLYGYRC